jgi:hypothetical protein
MASDMEFSEHAKKVLDLNDKLNQLRAGGKITDELYKEKREVIDKHFSSLKEQESELLDTQISALEENRKNIESQKNSGLMSGSTYLSLEADLVRQIDDILSEKQMLELSTPGEYPGHLKGCLDASRMRARFMPKPTTPSRKTLFTPATPPRSASFGRDMFSGSSEGAAADEVPPWAWVVYAFLIGYPILIGSMYRMPLLLLIYVGGQAFSILFGTAFLHFLTVVVRIPSASIKRAFTCGALTRILVFIVGVAVSIPVMFLAIISPGLALVVGIPLLLASYIAYIAIAVYSLKSIYAASSGQAVAVLLLGAFVAIIIAVMLLLLALPFASLNPMSNNMGSLQAPTTTYPQAQSALPFSQARTQEEATASGFVKIRPMPLTDTAYWSDGSFSTSLENFGSSGVNMTGLAELYVDGKGSCDGLSYSKSSMQAGERTRLSAKCPSAGRGGSLILRVRLPYRAMVGGDSVSMVESGTMNVSVR